MRKALRGNWRDEHLFALRQALEGWEFYQRQIRDCDAHIEEVLRQLAAQAGTPPDGTAPLGENAPSKRIHHNAPEIKDLHRLLVQIHGGNDLSTLPGLTDYSVLQLAAEIGTDMTPWPTAKHFTAWLALAPRRRDSGKRRRHARRPRTRAGQILCVLARSLARSKYLALGGFYRRLRATRGPQVANIAAARKLAVLIYNTLRFGRSYVERGLQHYEATYRQHLRKRLERQARSLGFSLTPVLTPNHP
jgi:hypothetical protein